MAVLVKEVDDGVIRVTTSDPRDEIVSRVNSYLIERPNGKYLMVDSGWASSSSELVGTIRAEFGEGAVERLLLTHLHPDHFGGAKAIVEGCRAKMSYHRREVLHWTYYNLLRKNLRRAVDILGTPAEVLENARARITASRALVPEPDSYLADGSTFGSRSGPWRVVHTPGHSPGHVCLYRPKDRMLISGDHILAGETPNVAFYPVRGYHALRSYFTSLAKAKRLAPRSALPAHGDVIGDVGARVEVLLSHHEERLLEVFEGLSGGTRSVGEVASSVRWSRGSFEELGPFNRWLAILETISHLEFLSECGVARKADGAMRSYRQTGRDWSLVGKAMADLSAA